MPQVAAHADTLDLFGRQKISFAELAKRVWEENEYEVICEPSGLYWYEMSQHWTKTKFIHLTREVNSWIKSLHDFCRPVMDMEKARVTTARKVFRQTNPVRVRGGRRSVQRVPFWIILVTRNQH